MQRQRKQNKSLFVFLLILPSLLIIFGVMLYPVLYSAWISLHSVNLLSTDHSFIGFGNYIAVLKDTIFWSSLGRTLYFTIVSLLIQTILGLLIASILNQEFIGRNWVRAIILLPWAVPDIVNGVLWEWIFNASYGVLNRLLMFANIIDKPVVWLGEPLISLNMVIVADTWKMLPFYIILFLAGMQTIPKELYEAAKIDGSSSWKSFTMITMPLLAPILLVVLVLRTMQSIGVFDLIYIMTGGGPNNGTMVISYYTYVQSFGNMDFSSGASVSFLVAMLVLFISLIYIKVLRMGQMESR